LASLNTAATTVVLHAPHATAELLAVGYTAELYRNFVWGQPTTYHVPEHTRFADGDLIPYTDWEGNTRHVEVVAAPGHCNDHHVLVAEDAGVVFSADLFVTARPMMYRDDELPLVEMTSLRKVLQRFTFDTLLCSHRGVVVGGRARLEERLAHLEEVQAAVMARKQAGLQLEEVVAELGAKDGFLSWYSSGRFSGCHLISAFFNK
jgi:glyoxylase-like metal-dependent hydrolase (beta-lactamase superfamily II)